MDNWIMLMEHYPSGEEIKLEGLQDENSKVGYGVSEIVSIEKVKCVEVKAPEYYPSGEGEESKTFLEVLEKYKEIMLVCGIGGIILGLGSVTKLYIYGVQNWFVDITYMRKSNIGMREIVMLNRIEMYLIERLSLENLRNFEVNSDSKYFIYRKYVDVENRNRHESYKLMPADFEVRLNEIYKKVQNLKKEDPETNLEECIKSFIPFLVNDCEKRISEEEYCYLLQCIINNEQRRKMGLLNYIKDRIKRRLSKWRIG